MRPWAVHHLPATLLAAGPAATRAAVRGHCRPHPQPLLPKTAVLPTCAPVQCPSLFLQFLHALFLFFAWETLVHLLQLALDVTTFKNLL